ncbi:minor capsid protein [Subtercola endophyticus]|uniref:minor capsid protein n=1 Tax=Subtercola endophyticus TaxID=2895559 RepID=UPI001E3BC211|nr:minor capsid protein [Subtercola endophyticus]UFS59473.1 minor capsid protein [Subtercola endophyticus]
MSVTTDLLTGIAGLLDNAGIGVTYRANAPYTAGETGVFFLTMPAAPDRLLVLNIIPMSDYITVAVGRVLLQVAGRGLRNNALDVDSLMDAVFGVLHGRTDLTFGTAHVIQMNRDSAVPMGQDENIRNERADKYWLDVDYPATVYRPS